MNLKEMVLRGESEILEFKESLQLKDEIGENISAFSNSKGGVILVGVSDKRKIRGVQIGRKTLTDLAEYIKRNTDPQIFPEIKVCEADNRKIISIRVKESDEKPVFFKSYTYKRVGDTNQRISSSEIRRLAKESGGKTYWDEQICEEANFKDVDEEEVRRFLKEARNERNLNIPIDTPVDEVLMRLSASRNGKLTNASILLFGKQPQNFFLQAEVRCVRFEGNEPVKPFIDMKIISGSVIEQVDKSLSFVLEHIPKRVWLAGRVQREERYQYPPDAIREAIVNAICHRNYEEKGNVQIRVFNDYMEVWSPGELPSPLIPEDLKRTHKSIPRNPLIARQFFWIRFIEEVGTGTNDMIKYCKEWKIPEPEFKYVTGDFVVTFRGKITEEYLKNSGLNERQIKALEYVKKQGNITNKEYQEVNNISRNTASAELKAMVKAGILKSIGTGKRNLKYVMK